MDECPGEVVDTSAASSSLGEERRDEVNARLRLVLDNTADVIVQYSTDGTLLWASPSLRRELGWFPEDVVGTRAELIHPDDRDLLRRGLEEASAAGTDTISGRARAVAADGSTRWVHGITRIVRADDGSVASLVSSLRDITEQVATERALADSERNYRMLADNATDVVIHTGSDGLIDWVSPSVRQILGRRPSELIGSRVIDFMHPADVGRTMQMIHELLALGQTGGRTEARFDTAHGRWRWMSMVGRGLFDADGALVGGIDTLRDIQSEHDAREELRRLATRDRSPAWPTAVSSSPGSRSCSGTSRTTVHARVSCSSTSTTSSSSTTSTDTTSATTCSSSWRTACRPWSALTTSSRGSVATSSSCSCPP